MSKAAQPSTGNNEVVSAPKSLVQRVLKRDGSIVPFEQEKIKTAIWKAMQASEDGSLEEAEIIGNKVYAEIARMTRRYKTFVPSVEGLQDAIEKELILSDYVKAAKAFILYRDERARTRKRNIAIPEEVKEKAKESSAYFGSSYQEFIFYRTYSRWIEERGRRETWVEAVDRFMEFMKENLGTKLTKKEYSEVREGILMQEICPSMRLLWSAGDACRETNVWAYNCSFIAPTKLRDFSEVMYILMCGAGCGYTVESETVQQLPQIKRQTGKTMKTHVVEDSKEGWANAFHQGMEAWFAGKDLEFDYSKIRPAGARLKKAGGRASGPQPLVNLIDFARRKVLSRQGKRLSNLDVHDILCMIGEIVVAGGVRRSSLISLSDLDDHELRDAKKGQFYLSHPYRSMANNSAVYLEKPSTEEFLKEWTALVESKSGERGIFNRSALEKQMPARRWDVTKQYALGTNPCGEILLRSKQFCNLTSIVARPNDTRDSLKRKMRLATILGTYQSTLTNFGYLSKDWATNCQEERLLGVSITGYYDNDVIRDDEVLEELRDYSVEVNKKYAQKFSINQSTSITTVKPHGNSSQLLDTASGMHPRYAPYYIRRVRISRTDPLFVLAKEQGVPCFPEVGQTEETATTFVLEFPLKAPKGAIVQKDVSALDLLQEWKRLKKHFTEHNPSVTISVGDNEWIGVANFVYENWDYVGGLSFLPRTDHVYKLAPYEPITQEEYKKRVKEMPQLDFSHLYVYENQDQTTGSKEFACVSGDCEL